MANYDHPAYVWNVISKAMTTVEVQRDELEIPSVTPSQLPEFVQAFEGAGLGGGGPASYPFGGT